jgi:hypothetical protein
LTQPADWDCIGRMRWKALFDDVEAQLLAADRAALAAEVGDRTRREHAAVRVVDRLRGALGQSVVLQLPGVGPVRGAVDDVGPDWVLLAEATGRELLVPLHAVSGVLGLGREVAVPGSEGAVARGLDLGWAVRGLARNRAGVTVLLTDGSAVAGTVDRAGADHLDLAEHPAGEPRRAGTVQQVRLVPFSAVAGLRRA